MLHLLCLMGLPGSGKSYLSLMIEQKKLGFEEVLQISFDNFIKWNSDCIIKQQRQNILLLVEDKVKTYLNNNIKEHSLLIILDDNMYYRSMRFDYFKLAKKYNVNFSIVFVDTPITECFKNNYTRNSSVPTHVLLDMNDKMEPPSSNNYWESNSIKIRYKEDTIEECLNKINILINNSRICETNYIKHEKVLTEKAGKIHLADLALRRLVSEFVRKAGSSEEQSRYINRRLKILGSIKKGLFILPDIQNDSPKEVLIQYANYLKPEFIQ